MTTDAKVLEELLSRWQQALADGRDVSAAELCRDHPELVTELEQHIEAIRRSDELASAVRTPIPDTDRTPRPPIEPQSGAWPSLPGYEIVGKLGQGGMGVVYEARERDSGQLIALKVIREMSAEALSHFKREFRSLVGLSHPNLVSLHELFFDGRVWFFTMERVEGNSFLNYVRGTGTAAPAGPVWERLRRALAGLATGLTALHEAGKLHRDLKPSNVLVAKDGRVVILDFGLAAELSGEGLYESEEQHVVGTVSYMAPEQAASKPISAVSDWYSVGVMLYQALTDRLPFSGSMLHVLQIKQFFDPPPPGALALHLPADLCELCVELLRRDPRQRPAGREVLRRLGAVPVAAVVAALPHPLTPGQVPLVGRTEHLAALTEALATVRAGRAVLVRLQGRSGVGKSALMRCFLDGLRGSADTVILSGRCYEQESVPYKALDSLVDTLCQYLKQVPPGEAAALLPRDVAALARVFPVLGQVPAIAGAPQRAAEIPDVQELRRRAVASLRDLLARLGERKLLVLAIDDLQWGDVDSAAILVELLQPPDPPVLLLLGCYRSEDLTVSPFLRTFLQTASGSGGCAGREVTVNPLTPAEARDLALTLLEPLSPTAETQAEAVARESGGSPFFVHELVQNLWAGGVGGEPGSAEKEVDLDKVLWARIARLPDEPRRLLEVLAVAGHPLAQETACRAAGLGTVSRSALSFLRSGRLIRGRGYSEGQEIEPYHDRVRETTVSHLAPVSLKETHRCLAQALETAQGVDPELLATHFQGAGEAQRAGQYFDRAGDQAAQALAFDRAARLYRAALELRMPSGDDGRVLRTKFADALANAGRGAEAAPEYEAAALGAMGTPALELQRRAAYQYCISGHIDQGKAALAAVLTKVGLRMPRTRWRALLSLLFGRARLWLRGLRFQERDERTIPPEELIRIDVSWSAAIGLTMIDTIRGADFQAQNLLLALRAGEPYRVARALAWQAAHVAGVGTSTRRSVRQLLGAADELAGRIDHPHAQGMVQLATGVTAFFQSNWSEALRSCDRAQELFRERCTGVVWETVTAQSFSLWSLFFLGEVPEIAARLPRQLEEARRRGDLLAEASVSNFGGTLAWLAADDPEGARQAQRRAMGQWALGEFHTQHFTSLAAETQIDLYCGDASTAWVRIVEQWPALKGSLLLQLQAIRVFMVHLRAHCALAAAVSAARPTPLLQAAERDARRLEGEHAHWATALALLIRAALATFRGGNPRAASLLATAATELRAADMGLFAAAVLYRRGELLGGDEGQSMMAEGEAWMRNRGIKSPQRMTQLYVPGFRAAASQGPGQGTESR